MIKIIPQIHDEMTMKIAVNKTMLNRTKEMTTQNYTSNIREISKSSYYSTMKIIKGDVDDFLLLNSGGFPGKTVWNVSLLVMLIFIG